MRQKRKLLVLCLPVIAALMLCSCARRQTTAAVGGFEEWEVLEPERISPEVAYQHVKSGKAILVCAYDDNETCRRLHLDDAMSLYEFEKNLMYIPVKKEIIFYCA